MKDIKATVITRYDLDLGGDVVLKDATKTDHEELTRWSGTLYVNGHLASGCPTQCEAFVWTHRGAAREAFGGFFRELFGGVLVDGLQVVAASENLTMLSESEGSTT